MIVKLGGVLAGALLFGYAATVAWHPAFARVDDRYALWFGRIGLALILVAVGGFFQAGTARFLEAAGYTVGVVWATRAFARMHNHPDRFADA